VSTAAVVLAAGGGTRFAGPSHKLLAPFRGHTVFAWVLDAVLAAGLDETIVVVGAVDLRSELDGRPVLVVDNPDWQQGQATSLRAGWTTAQQQGHDAVVVGLGDQPLVPSSAWRAVAEGTTPIVVATYEGRRRNPVRLAHQVWPLLSSSGDEGAREVLRERPDLVSEVPCAGHADDIDTVEDLRRWNLPTTSRSSGQSTKRGRC